MRVLVDTNVLVSAPLFPRSKPAVAISHIAVCHQLFICEQTVAELVDVLTRKAAHLLPKAREVLERMSYELIPALGFMGIAIRDLSDQPILNAAIAYNMDVILTGDKDFLALHLSHPRCLTAAQFLDQEGIA